MESVCVPEVTDSETSSFRTFFLKCQIIISSQIKGIHVVKCVGICVVSGSSDLLHTGIRPEAKKMFAHLLYYCRYLNRIWILSNIYYHIVLSDANVI
jgi:hypothetical protein